MNNAFKPADILVPKKSVDMNKWSVIACDQYTSEPEYWKQTSKIVGQNYSSLNLILPEIYLEDENVKEKIENIHKNGNLYPAIIEILGFFRFFDNDDFSVGRSDNRVIVHDNDPVGKTEEINGPQE